MVNLRLEAEEAVALPRLLLEHPNGLLERPRRPVGERLFELVLVPEA